MKILCSGNVNWGISLRKVLVVDDDELVRPTVSAMLSLLSFNVTEASRGKDALQLISEENFDLIVTDLFMPGVDGFDLIIKIRKITSKTPIILMTGGGRFFPQGSGALNSVTDSAEFLGASVVLQKPFRKENLTRVLAQVFPAG